jgi:photosystem II stability/assembly factor-like uncharacterized protein
MLVAALGNLFTTVNLGYAQTWTQSSTPITNWSGVAAAADGNKLVAVVWTGGIYTSTNSGTTWMRTSAPWTNWSAVASSADGSKLVASVFNNGPIYVSTNSGTT